MALHVIFKKAPCHFITLSSTISAIQVCDIIYGRSPTFLSNFSDHVEKEAERKPSVKRVSFGVNDFLQVMERRRFHSDSAILEVSTNFDEPAQIDEIEGRRLSDNVFVDRDCQQSQNSEAQSSRGFESQPVPNSVVRRKRTASGMY